MIPCQTIPCKNCPFRKDSQKGWLGKDRMEEILKQGSFICHKTSELQDRDKRQCAGHMLLREDKNDFYYLAHRMQIKLGLKGSELVFDTEKDCIDHHT